MLALARQKFISDLTNIYSDIQEKKTHSVYANRECDAIHAFYIQALPMTVITTFAGGVSGFTTAGPVQGTGLGGIDKRVPAIGLDAAKSILERDLKNVYSHGDVPHPASVQAQKIVKAIEKYLKSAIVRTKEITASPMPAPASSGPPNSGGVSMDIVIFCEESIVILSELCVGFSRKWKRVSYRSEGNGIKIKSMKGELLLLKENKLN